MSTSAAELSNTVKVQDAGPSRKKLHIEIPAETVSAKLRSSMDTLADTAELPGFRRGRVPRWLVEKRFGSAVRQDCKNQLVNEALTKAIEDHKLKVVGDPAPAGDFANAELADGKPFAFDLEVEVMPEFEMPKLEGIAVKKPKIDVTDAMVDDEIKKITVNEGNLDSRDKAEAGDYITGHAVMTGEDGTEFYNLKGAVVQKPAADKGGKGMILGIVVDDFDKQLGSPKAGDSFTIKAKGPEGHEIEKLRGQKLTVAFTVDRIDRIIPASIDEIVKNYGWDSVERFRDGIRQRMSQRAHVQVQTVMHQQVAKHLVDSVKMDLPERLTSQQAARTLERRRMELMYRGFEPAKIEEHIGELRAASGKSAASDLKLFFILSKAADDLKVQVTEGEMNQRIAAMAMQRGERPEKLRQEIIQSNRAGAIWQQIREHKTLDVIVGKATVTEMSTEEFDKAMVEANKA
jgi:trigger factor